MELKYFVILSVLGLAAGFTVPTPELKAPELSGDIPSSVDLETSFPQGFLGVDPTSDLTRDKRDLLEKLFKDDKTHTVYVRRRYESYGDAAYKPQPEVHYYHYGQPSYPTYPIIPNQEYHHYHGYQQQGQQGYNSGAAPQQNYYGNGGYGQYVGHNTPAARPSRPQQKTPINTSPLSSGRNTVNKGQGAAAVNNIAIINARAGSSTINLERKTLPQHLPVDVADLLNN